MLYSLFAWARMNKWSGNASACINHSHQCKPTGDGGIEGRFKIMAWHGMAWHGMAHTFAIMSYTGKSAYAGRAVPYAARSDDSALAREAWSWER